MKAKIEVLKADITTLEVDAIVNAANSSLLGGGGVDGAIHRAGGPAILDACRDIRAKQGGCSTGEAVITTAGNLPAQYVIHTVGPVWNGGDHLEAKLLANCYTNSLKLAEEKGLKSVAFPNISTGVYKYPKAPASAIALITTRKFLQTASSIESVVFVCFDQLNYDLYWKALN